VTFDAQDAQFGPRYVCSFSFDFRPDYYILFLNCGKREENVRTAVAAVRETIRNSDNCDARRRRRSRAESGLQIWN